MQNKKFQNVLSEKQQQQRYSLIYYETGHEFVPPGPAVFSVPSEEQPTLPPQMA